MAAQLVEATLVLSGSLGHVGIGAASTGRRQATASLEREQASTFGATEAAHSGRYPAYGDWLCRALAPAALGGACGTEETHNLFAA